MGELINARDRFPSFYDRQRNITRAKKLHALYLKWRAQEDAREKAEEEARRAEMFRDFDRQESRFHSAKRRAAKLKRTPKWADAEKIRAIYALAAQMTRETGVQHVVDHVIPLQGTTVSGLHVETNLQVITASENNKKYNFWSDGA